MRKANRPTTPFDRDYHSTPYKFDKDFDESKHPRDENGRWTDGSGGPAADRATQVKEATQSLMANARTRDKEITPLLQGIVEGNGGEMLGLEHRIKTNAGRIAEKINEKMAIENMSLEQAQGSVYDSLRYTAQFNPDNYTEGVENLLGKLQEQGITPFKGKDKNYWPPPPGIYHGMNYVMQDKNGFKFELQFHTKESFAAKQDNHGLYEKFRSPGTSPSERYDLWNKMNQRWANVKVPLGVKRIGRPQSQEMA